MRWHRRPAVLSQACWPEQRPKGPPGSLLHMQCILLTAFCDYVVKVMESGHQDWEKTRQVTILDKEWDTENWWELGNVIWIKKKKTKTPKQTLDPALLSCHWNQILREDWKLKIEFLRLELWFQAGPLPSTSMWQRRKIAEMKGKIKLWKKRDYKASKELFYS